MRSKIEESLDLMNDDFKVFSTLVLKQFSAIKKLYSSDPEICREVYREMEMTESALDGFEVKMREEVVRSIVLFGPRASDLRKILAYLDMSSFLERMGDLMMNVAEYTLQLRSEAPALKSIRERLFNLFCQAEKMAQNAIFSFSCEDSILAKNVIAKDNAIDELQAEITQSIVEIPLSGLVQEDLRDMVGMGSMAYNIERIADHATNIAESALFLMEGKEWRHKGTEER